MWLLLPPAPSSSPLLCSAESSSQVCQSPPARSARRCCFASWAARSCKQDASHNDVSSVGNLSLNAAAAAAAPQRAVSDVRCMQQLSRASAAGHQRAAVCYSMQQHAALQQQHKSVAALLICASHTTRTQQQSPPAPQRGCVSPLPVQQLEAATGGNCAILRRE